MIPERGETKVWSLPASWLSAWRHCPAGLLGRLAERKRQGLDFREAVVVAAGIDGAQSQRGRICRERGRERERERDGMSLVFRNLHRNSFNQVLNAKPCM